MCVGSQEKERDGFMIQVKEVVRWRLLVHASVRVAGARILHDSDGHDAVTYSFCAFYRLSSYQPYSIYDSIKGLLTREVSCLINASPQ